EPKADIFSIDQNAVKIMTIHRAKGLEAPVVFLLNIEDINSKSGKNDIFFYKKEESGYVYILKKESDKDFQDYFKKQLLEEEKRILYVALTRARQFLFISGINKDTPIIKMLNKFREKYKGIFEKGQPLPQQEIKEKGEKILSKFTPFLSFTKEKKEIKKTYLDTLIGTIVHKIIYEIGNGNIEFNIEKIKKRTEFYLYKYQAEIYKDKIISLFEQIQKNEEIKKIIESPVSEKVKIEYPFICEIDGVVYEGVIDKMFIEKEKIRIYEFKTYLENLEDYKKQLEIYKNGVEKIFKNKVECYIVNLSKCKIIKIDNKKTKL
ncbi:MAG: hypothetical protein NC915_00185, partial [Candidatus Omnitrophica bacterium]|nr:hypothetical protein [Candidatus Omnitrophota bacterium]